MLRYFFLLFPAHPPRRPAGDAQKAGHRHLPRRRRRRPVPLAGGRDGPGGQGVERGPERLRPRATSTSSPAPTSSAPGSRPSWPPRRRPTADSQYRPRQAVRHAPAAAQGAAVPRRPARPGQARRGEGARRPDGNRREGDHGHRLVRPVAGRVARGRVAVEGRQRERATCTSTTRRPAKLVHEVIPRVKTGPPAATWRGPRTARGSTTPATRAARSGREADRDFYQQVYFHALGTPDREGPLRDSARTSRGSPRCGCTMHDQTRPAAGVGRRTATAGSSPSSSASRTASTAVQHVQGPARAGRVPARTGTCSPCPARTPRGGRSCALRRPTSI